MGSPLMYPDKIYQCMTSTQELIGIHNDSAHEQLVEIYVMNCISFVGLFVLVGIFSPSFNPVVVVSELYPSWLLALTI